MTVLQVLKAIGSNSRERGWSVGLLQQHGKYMYRLQKLILPRMRVCVKYDSQKKATFLHSDIFFLSL